MSERRDSWLARLTGADQRHAELERMSEEVAALRAELATERALTDQQAAELEQRAREHEQLEEELELLAAQSLAADEAVRHARSQHAQQLAEAEQRASSAAASLQRQSNELALERTRASTAIRQAQAAQARIDALQQAASARDQELTELRTAHDKVLKKNDALEERLSRNEHQLAMSAQQNGELTSRMAAMSASQQRALREERRRWLLLASGFWKALLRALGPTAAVPLARELDGERVLGALSRADSPEAAAVPLARALAELSLCQRVAIARQGKELELRLQEPARDAKGAQGWVGIFAVQCLGSMLGRSLQTSNVHDQDGELVVRARFRDRDESAAPSSLI
jgi:hypothetical protein